LSTPHAPSYYAATATPSPERPPLHGERDADVCIVGAGFTGLSTALHLAAAGRRVVVLEAAKVGWGASGRNGGQIVNGLNAGLDTIHARYGSDTAAFFGGMLQEGAGIIRGLITEHDIACDLKPLNVYTALNKRHMAALEAKQALWARHGMHDHEMLDRDALKAHVHSERYCGGMLDRSGGHLHPLNLALGEAAALEKLGGVVHEQTPVTHITHALHRSLPAKCWTQPRLKNSCRVTPAWKTAATSSTTSVYRQTSACSLEEDPSTAAPRLRTSSRACDLTSKRSFPHSRASRLSTHGAATLPCRFRVFRNLDNSDQTLITPWVTADTVLPARTCLDVCCPKRLPVSVNVLTASPHCPGTAFPEDNVFGLRIRPSVHGGTVFAMHSGTDPSAILNNRQRKANDTL